ncbi:heavy metal-associated domain-containing protein [Paracoccus marcusii]|nr:heavy metal-associated domain-containing protein [Paracoccus marcusii]
MTQAAALIPADGLPVTRLAIRGMSCAACSGRVGRVLSARPTWRMRR